MATQRGNNNSNLNSSPIQKVEVSEAHGRLRRVYDEITFGADSEFQSGDDVLMGRIPKDAQLVQAILTSDGQIDSSSTDIDVGWDGGVNGNETEDVNGILDGVNQTSAFVQMMIADGDTSAPNAGYNKQFSDEVNLKVTSNSDTDSSNNVTLTLEAWYALD